MVDTLTKNAKLVKFEAGSRVNTWKPDFDTEIIDPLDSMLGEKLPVTVDTVDITLSTAQFRAACLACSGTLTGARALIMPGIQERWLIIDNRCTPGVYTLQAKQDVAGALADIPYGPNLVHWDGSASAPTVMPVPLYGVTDVATAATCLIGNTPTTDVRLTGSVTISSFGTSPSGVVKRLRAAASVTITYNATSMQLPGGIDLFLSPGDGVSMLSTGGGNWNALAINRVGGYPVTPFGPEVVVASAATTDLNVSTSNAQVTGNVGITSFGSTAPAGKVVLARFTGTLTITQGANLLTPGGSNLGVNPNDFMLAEHMGAGVWRVINFVRASGNLSGAFITASNGITATNGSNIATTDGNFNANSLDTSATVAPYLQLIRDSASPAVNDGMGIIAFSGNDAGGTSRVYSYIYSSIAATTTNAVSGRILAVASAAGVATEIWRAAGAGASNSTFSAFRGTDYVAAGGGNNSGLQVHAAGYTLIEASAGETLGVKRIDATGTLVNFYGAQQSQGSISLSGTTVSYNAFVGAHWSRFEDNAMPAIVPGTIMETVDKMVEWIGYRRISHKGEVLESDGLPEGHTDLKVGDTFQLTETWEEEDPEAPPDPQTGNKHRRQREHKIPAEVIILANDTLPYCKVAGVASRRVYGVFFGMLDEDGIHNDFSVASLGAYFILMAPGQSPQAGDFIESAGNGMGRVMTDDTLSVMEFHRRMVGKVSAAVKVKTYADGSFTMPCTLHCG